MVFLFLRTKFCPICYSCYFLPYLLLSLFRKQDKFLLVLRFCEIWGLFDALLCLSLSKPRILLNLLSLLFLPYLLLSLFRQQEKFLLLYRNMRSFRGPSWPFLFLSLEFFLNLLFILFLQYLLPCIFRLQGYFFVFVAKFATFSRPF